MFRNNQIMKSSQNFKPKYRLTKICIMFVLCCALVFSVQAQDINRVDNIVTLRSMAVSAHMEGDYAQLEKIADRIEQLEPGSSTAAHYKRLVKLAKESDDEDASERTTGANAKQSVYFTPTEAAPLRQDFPDVASPSKPSSGLKDLPLKSIGIYGGAGIGAIVILLLLIKMIGKIKNKKKDIQVEVQEDSDSLDFSEVPQANTDFDDVPDHLSSSDFDSVEDVKNPMPPTAGSEPDASSDSGQDADSMPVSFGFDSNSLDDSQQPESYQATPTVSDLDDQNAMEDTSQDEDMEDLIGFPESDISGAPTLITDLDSTEGQEDEKPEAVTADNAHIPQADLESVVKETENEDTDSPVFLFESDQSESSDEPTVAAGEAMTFELGSDVDDTPKQAPGSTPASDDDLIAEFNLNDAETLLDIAPSQGDEPSDQAQENVSTQSAPLFDDAKSEFPTEFEVGDDLFAESNETKISEPLPDLPDIEEDDDVISFDDDAKK